jgi:hypothetical protein
MKWTTIVVVTATTLNVSMTYLMSACPLHAEETTTAIDLTTIPNGKDWSLVGRKVDLRGEDIRQRSFLGIAFRITTGAELSYDVVWFRPFNFKSNEAIRRTHGVQYASYPNFPWDTLRKEKPGVYENAVNPVPNPAGWFHAKIELNHGKVRVYVNDAKTPCLVVDELVHRKAGAIGLWVGADSGGDFANLKFKQAR